MRTCSIAWPGGGVGSGVGVDLRVAVPRIQARAPAPGLSHDCPQRGQQQHHQWRAAVLRRYSAVLHVVECLVGMPAVGLVSS